ncbi:hypothetical protein [Enterococcus sp. DIV0187]|uniref:hypothetical protein n=1 Tax=Enterococcus sp. DIV0187 TaxID=2774644 RepID=UPI003F682C9D
MSDKNLNIAVAANLKQSVWDNVEGKWSSLVNNFKQPVITSETFDEFQAMDKGERGPIKDVGSFVGGVLLNGRRSKHSILRRDLITLDIDFPDQSAEEIWEKIAATGLTVAVYTTHSATVDDPRMRVVAPLFYPVSSDDYEPLARAFAAVIGIGMDAFDDTSYQAERLMFLPSVSQNGYFYFNHQNGQWIDPKVALTSFYKDYTDANEWPRSTREEQRKMSYGIKKLVAKCTNEDDSVTLQNAFNTVYDVDSAIEAFLTEVYCYASANRYTYLLSNSGVQDGLAVYSDGGFASFHDTDAARDPWSFDAYGLVMAHHFGTDYEAKLMMDEWINDELQNVVEKQKELLLKKVKKVASKEVNRDVK